MSAAQPPPMARRAALMCSGRAAAEVRQWRQGYRADMKMTAGGCRARGGERMARDIETSTRGRGTTGTGYGARRRGAQQQFFLRIWGALRSRNECARLGRYRPMGATAPHRDIGQYPRGAARGGEIKAPDILKKKIAASTRRLDTEPGHGGTIPKCAQSL